MASCCAICLEDVTDVRCVGVKSKIVFPRRSSGCSLRCGHLFHQACIKGWVCKGNLEEENVGCPMCRQDIVFKRQPFYTFLVHQSREYHRRKALDLDYEDDEEYLYDEDDDNNEDDEDDEDDEEDHCQQCRRVLTAEEPWWCYFNDDGSDDTLCEACHVDAQTPDYKKKMDRYRRLECMKQLWMATRVMTRVESRRLYERQE